MSPNDVPVILDIKKIEEETENVKTFTFQHKLVSRPGQFVMLWVPGVDQKPFSIGQDTGDKFQLTIYQIGEATKALFKMKKGDKVGISGPYGTCYRFRPESDIIAVGGGYGAAPLGYLAEAALSKKCSVNFCVGARDKGNLLFEKRLKNAGATVHVATEDGSAGHQGYITDTLEELLVKRQEGSKLENTKVFTCGPELMQKKVAEICRKFKVDCEVSVERYMKCGFGICGNCCVDDEGIPMCQQGPVLSGEKALSITEFGNYHRDKTGQRKKY